MAEVSGKLGDVSLSNYDTSVHSWTLSYVGDSLETTDFDDSTGGRSYIPGLTSWTGSFDCYYSTGNSGVPGAIGTIIMRTTTGTAGLFTGDIVITGMEIATPIDGIVTQSYTFTGNGALALTT